MSHIDTFRAGRSYRNSIPAMPKLTAPERLVGLGFRCWLTGFQTSDIGCWAVAWDAFSQAVGPRTAKPLMTELASWVRAVQDTAERRIELFPAKCNDFCRDECLAISMVAACQHCACPAFRACAIALLGSDEIDEAMDCAEEFAMRLKEADQLLSPGTVFMGANLLSPAAPGGRLS